MEIQYINNQARRHLNLLQFVQRDIIGSGYSVVSLVALRAQYTLAPTSEGIAYSRKCVGGTVLVELKSSGIFRPLSW